MLLYDHITRAAEEEEIELGLYNEDPVREEFQQVEETHLREKKSTLLYMTLNWQYSAKRLWPSRLFKHVMSVNRPSSCSSICGSGLCNAFCAAAR